MSPIHWSNSNWEAQYVMTALPDGKFSCQLVPGTLHSIGEVGGSNEHDSRTISTRPRHRALPHYRPKTNGRMARRSRP